MCVLTSLGIIRKYSFEKPVDWRRNLSLCKMVRNFREITACLFGNMLQYCLFGNYANCLYSLIQEDCISVSVYGLDYKSSRLLYELRTEYFAGLKSGPYGLSQKETGSKEAI